MSLRSPLSRVLNHGTARSGVSHWRSQRVTATALVPLSAWVMISLLALPTRNYALVSAWIASGLHPVLLALTILLAAWHASLEVGQPIPNTDFLVGVFPTLGENRREALKIAAGFRGEEAFQAGVSEEQALDTVLPRLSRERAIELANECIQLYMWDRLGCDN